MRCRIRAAGAVALAAFAVPASALAYTGRRAAHVEAQAILKDAERTQPCGYNGHGHLSGIRIVEYKARGVLFKWAETDWTIPGANRCALIFLHARGHSFSSTQTPRHARVAWLPFTWGSSPFESSSYLNQHWRRLGFAAAPPRWAALAKAL